MTINRLISLTDDERPRAVAVESDLQLGVRPAVPRVLVEVYADRKVEVWDTAKKLRVSTRGRAAGRDNPDTDVVGVDTYVMVGAADDPKKRLVWAHMQDGAVITKNTLVPDADSGRRVTQVPLAYGSVVLWIRKYRIDSPRWAEVVPHTKRWAARIPQLSAADVGPGSNIPWLPPWRWMRRDGVLIANLLPILPVVSKRRPRTPTGWTTVIELEEWT